MGTSAPGTHAPVLRYVTGSFKGVADPGASGTTDPGQGYGQPLTSSGPVKGTIEYDVYSSTPPDPAKLLPNQAPDTSLGAVLNQLFGGNATIVGGGNYATNPSIDRRAGRARIAARGRAEAVPRRLPQRGPGIPGDRAVPLGTRWPTVSFGTR